MRNVPVVAAFAIVTVGGLLPDAGQGREQADGDRLGEPRAAGHGEVKCEHAARRRRARREPGGQRERGRLDHLQRRIRG